MINKEKYKLPNNNYHEVEYPKSQIVIGHNGRKDMRHFEGWVNRRNKKSTDTSNFTITKSGLVYQHFEPKYYSDFLGVEQDKGNISILLVNEGWLKEDNIHNIYIDWLGHTYSKKTPVINQMWRGHHFWVKYTDEQMISLKELLNYLCDEFDIKKECVGNCVFNEDVDIFNGITFRSNYNQNITDISPAFDMDKLKEL
jgi:hypothetical protein